MRRDQKRALHPVMIEDGAHVTNAMDVAFERQRLLSLPNPPLAPRDVATLRVDSDHEKQARGTLVAQSSLAERHAHAGSERARREPTGARGCRAVYVLAEAAR